MFKNKTVVVAGIVSFVLLALSFAFYTMSTGSQQEQLDAANAKYTQLLNKKGMLEAALASNNAEAVRSGTGMDAQRKAKDDTSAEDLAKLVTTWDSKKSYDEARNKAMQTYGLKEDGTFMHTFMPKVVEINSSEHSGTTNEIDANGTNMKYVGMTSYVTKIVGTKYYYLATVDVSSSNRAGNTATNTLMFSYMTDTNNKLSHIEGYTLAR